MKKFVRFIPQQKPESHWHVYDNVRRLFPNGFGMKSYVDEENCQWKCDEMNIGEDSRPL